MTKINNILVIFKNTKKFLTQGFYRYKINQLLSKFSLNLLFITSINKKILVKVKKLVKEEYIPNPFEWKKLDEEVQSRFLMDNNIEVIHNYTSNDVTGTQIVYEKKLIDKFIKLAEKKVEFYYGETDFHLYDCLDKYNISGKEVAIVGSTIPWYESIVLSRGGKPVTIEYNEIDSNDTRLELITVKDFNSIDRKFDFIINISSIEHDGLGRYGDPINPDGDLKTMERLLTKNLNQNGKLFLSIPVGKDKVVWNLHRIYGEKRLPLLFKGFNLLYSSGFDESLFLREDDYGKLSTKLDSNRPFQPVFVLEKNN